MKETQWINGGLQQIGVGVTHNNKALDFYHKELGFSIPMFDETGVADVMSPYMGGESWERHAVFAINIKGGGGVEIWQYTNRTPVGPLQEVSIANKGILASKIRCKNIYVVREQLMKQGREVSVIGVAPDNTLRCFVQDLDYNWICLEETNEGWFLFPKKREKKEAYVGGISGAIIGVSDMEKSLAFYREICGYDEIVYDHTSVFFEFDILRGQQKVRRVQIKKSTPNKGIFAPMLTNSTLELIEASDQEAHLFKGRYWGDIGFIHLCFDVRGMDALKQHCEQQGHPFTIDTGNEFAMDEASGRFAYLEDPDGTLIEFVEVYKLPLLTKYGIVMNIKKRAMGKPLPAFMLRALKMREHKKN